jgi:hypothetical protein
MRIDARCLFGFSRFGFRIGFAFFILALAFRATLPFGDEPDFTVQALYLVENEFDSWTPYYWMHGSLQQLNIYSNCAIVASPTEVTAQIDVASCGEGVGQVLGRTLFMVFITSPIWLVIMWRNLGLVLLSASVRCAPEKINRRIDALGLSLLLPGMIYYLGLLSHEQLTLLISLFVFFFWGNWLIIAGLLGLIGSLDLGNAVVVAAFLAIYIVITWALSIFGIKLASIMLGGFLTYVYMSGLESLNFIGYLPLLESKVNAILQEALDADFIDKYPLILRPIITFMTGVFMMPSGVKIFPLYLIYGAALLVMMNRLRLRKLHDIGSDLPVLLSVIATIMLFSFLLPNYTNAKYYMFLAPFILHSALTVFSRKWIFITLVGSAWMVPVGLILFRI